MARRKPPVIADQLLDQLLAGRTDAKPAFEKDGLLDELKKALAKRALNAEIDHHLATGEADGQVNSRNGYGEKRVLPAGLPLTSLAIGCPRSLRS